MKMIVIMIFRHHHHQRERERERETPHIYAYNIYTTCIYTHTYIIRWMNDEFIIIFSALLVETRYSIYIEIANLNAQLIWLM